MSVAAIVQRRREALLTDFCNLQLEPVLVSVPSAQVLGALTFLDEFEEDEDQLRLGRRAPGSVVVRRGAGDPDRAASLWVRSSYGGYRGAYRAFVKFIYGVEVSKLALSPYDVDHLLNRARSASGDAFLRVEAIPSGDNQHWGSAYEGAASADGLPKNRQGFRYLSHTIAAKVAGLRPPSGPQDMVAINAIRAEFHRRGMPDEAMNNALEAMLGRDMRPR